MTDLKIRKRKRLREKEISNLANEISNRLGCKVFNTNDTVDIAESPGMELIFVDGQVLGFIRHGKAFLSIRGLLKYQATKAFVTVDMGAVRFIVNGADVMGPGILDADESIQIGDLVWVRDERNKKPLAVGEALISGLEMKTRRPGKAIKNLLFVGDKLWKLNEDLK
ncbi:MAG: PUA domain-containing protein [Methanomassiliicoccales archaeon]